MTAPRPQTLTVVMYHYVRELARSRYPMLKGLSVNEFRYQLSYFKKHYTFITIAELLAALDGEVALPPRAILLTFDDAYRDHYDYVFPELDAAKVQGAFYVAAQTLEAPRLLTPNKIHYLLASVVDPGKLVKAIFKWLDSKRKTHQLKSNEALYRVFAGEHRFDPPEVVFIKRLLQHGLSPELRGMLLDELFIHYVAVSEATLHEELYATKQQLKTMQRHGMHLGGHGKRHVWLSHLNAEEQRQEIEASYQALVQLGTDMSGWTFAYPYGDYDAETIQQLNIKGCSAAFGIQTGLAQLSEDKRFRLERFDTNDFPKED